MFDLELAVRRFLAERTGIGLDRIQPSTRLGEDLGVSGDDMDHLVKDLSKVFNVDVREYRWHYHTDAEGFTPLWWMVTPWWKKVSRIPVSTEDLVESARRGSWSIAYPDAEVIPRPDVGSLLTTAALVALIVSMLLLVMD